MAVPRSLENIFRRCHDTATGAQPSWGCCCFVCSELDRWLAFGHFAAVQKKREAVAPGGCQMYAYGSLSQLLMSTQGEMSHYTRCRIKHYSEGLPLGSQTYCVIETKQPTYPHTSSWTALFHTAAAHELVDKITRDDGRKQVSICVQYVARQWKLPVNVFPSSSVSNCTVCDD